MADIEFTQDVSPRSAPSAPQGGLVKLTNLAGAVVSLALLVGVSVWGYKLVVRDVSGVPVVRAVDGPMRIQPDNPGGRPADHQGLAVNAVAAAGSAAAPADTLVLAPRPVDLTDDDQPNTQLARLAMRPVAPPANRADAVRQPEEPTQPAENADADQADAQDDIDALVAEVTQSVEPVFLETPDVSEPPVTLELASASAATPQNLIAADIPGVTVSARPAARPARLSTTPAAEPSQTEETTSSDLDIDPAEVPTGTRVVQLGAYETADIARTEWDRIATQFGDYMTDKRRIVQQASSGGRTFFRLRAHGFDDLSAARRFCSALVAEGADCIPVVTR